MMSSKCEKWRYENNDLGNLGYSTSRILPFLWRPQLYLTVISVVPIVVCLLWVEYVPLSEFFQQNFFRFFLLHSSLRQGWRQILTSSPWKIFYCVQHHHDNNNDKTHLSCENIIVTISNMQFFRNWAKRRVSVLNPVLSQIDDNALKFMIIMKARKILKSISLIVAFCKVKAFAPNIGSTPSPDSSTTRVAPLDVSYASTERSHGIDAKTAESKISLEEWAFRDMYSFQEWAVDYGVQQMSEMELYSYDGSDWQFFSNSYIPANNCVLYVPSNLVFGSIKVSNEFGGDLKMAEDALVTLDQGTAKRLPLFRLVIKILAEYEKGENSQWFPWLNSLPRIFYNGVSMTDACFECLPPYAALLSINERNTYSRFVNAIRRGFVPLDPSTINDDRVVKWAYNVALTRFHEIWEPRRQKLIAPMADMVCDAHNFSSSLVHGNISSINVS